MLIMHEFIPSFPDLVRNIELHMNLGHYRVEVWEVDDRVDLKCVFYEPCTDIEDAKELFAIKVNEYK